MLNESGAYLELLAAANRRNWNGAQERRIVELIDQLTDEGMPPVPELRKPQTSTKACKAHGYEFDLCDPICVSLRPGERIIDGKVYYSSRWL